jgi:hypothetical protein
MISTAAATPLLATCLDHVVPLFSSRIGEHLAITGVQEREKSHVVRVVGDHEEIKRPRQLDLQAGRGGQFLTARKPMCVFR